MEAQFFALPPYIEQSLQQQPNMGFAGGSGPPFANGGPQMGASTAAQMPDGTAWPGQPQVNIGDIFGGAEWNQMLMSGGYQPS